MADLPVEIFAELRRRFFDDAGRPVPFPLRDKQNTQDDPFDEFLASEVFDDLPGIWCEKASGPLVAPDMVCYRSDGIDGAAPADLAGDASRIIALEGTYRDGVDRARPMLIFANPLGVPAFDRSPVMVHSNSDLSGKTPALRLVHRLRRSVLGGRARDFFCYRWRSDVPADWNVTDLVDPFPTPLREKRTRPRGRFRLSFRL